MAIKLLDALGVSAFCESMGMLVQSGIATDEAVSLLKSEKRGGTLEQGLEVMEREVQEGKSLSQAMETSGIFPDYCRHMIAAGERSGRLEDILFRLSRYYAQQKTIAEKLRSTILYPATMLILVIIVLVVMLTAVLPAFNGVYEKLTGSLAASAYGYIRGAYVLCAVILALTLVLALLLFAGVLLWRAGRRETVERALRKLPIFASVFDSLAMFRFTGALSTFLASGEMQDEAVLMSIPMAESAHLEEKLKRCAERMEEGHSIARAAWDEDLFEPVYGRMLLAGERSGSLENVLGRLTELYEEHCGATVDRVVSTVDPILSGVLIVTVGLSLLSVMLPLIGMMNAVG